MFWLLLVALMGSVYVYSKAEPSPWVRPNNIILLLTTVPFLVLMVLRLLYGLFCPAHSRMERAGKASMWLGTLLFAVVGAIYDRNMDRPVYSQTHEFVYMIMLILSLFLLLLGDIFRHFSFYRRGPGRY